MNNPNPLKIIIFLNGILSLAFQVTLKCLKYTCRVDYKHAFFKKKSKYLFSLLEIGSCSVCPITWLPYKDKCYWISNSIQSWNQSYKDCVAKGSQLLMISDAAEQVKESIAGEESITFLVFLF
uniref:C-type lectin domain-containing protein n=1 Tax=Pseudonaja textilis TaxID=8673 RepID=A0A670ZL80_PSETE